MSFAQVLFLLGAVGIAGPILAHLLARPRYRRIPFTMLRFLEVGRKDVQARRNIRNLLLLLLRSAIIVILAMLFAGPLIESHAVIEQPRPVHFIAVDNSFSMEYNDGTKYIDRALSEAGDLIRGASDDAMFSVYALASGDSVEDVDRAAALAWLERIKPVPLRARVEDFLSAVAAGRRNLAEKAEVHAAIVSDFTPSFLGALSEASEPIQVDGVRYSLVAPDTSVKNSAVESAAVADCYSGSLRISVRVANYGGDKETRSLSARVHGHALGRTDLDLSGFEKREVTLEIPLTELPSADDIPVEIALEGDDFLPRDDIFYLSISVPERRETNVRLFGSGRKDVFLLRTALEAVAEAGPFESINIEEVYYDAFEPAALRGADIAFFAGLPSVLSRGTSEIAPFLKAGGKAVFFLSEEVDQQAARALLGSGSLPALPGGFRQRETTIEPAAHAPDALSDFGKGSDTAAVLANYRLDRILLTASYECEPAEESICLWRLKTGDGFLYYRRAGNGASVLVNTSADDSLGTLMKSSAAVAFVRFLLGSRDAPESTSYTCGEEIILPATRVETRTARAARPVWIMTPSGASREASVVESVLIATCRDEVGWVKTLERPVRMAAVNVPEGETDMQPPSQETVAAVVSKALITARKPAEVIVDEERRKAYRPVWKYFAWLLAALILAEAFIANRTQR
ncbi:MAG: BatA domain-containing protein [Planctomycetota bacterium]